MVFKTGCKRQYLDAIAASDDTVAVLHWSAPHNYEQQLSFSSNRPT